MDYASFREKEKRIDAKLCKAMSSITQTAFIRDSEKRLNAMDNKIEDLKEAHLEMRKLINELYMEAEEFERRVIENARSWRGRILGVAWTRISSIQRNSRRHFSFYKIKKEQSINHHKI